MMAQANRTPGVLLLGNPFLRKVCVDVDFKDFADEKFQRTVQKLQKTLEDFRKRVGFGRAIAAPQIGCGKRMIAFHLDRNFVMFNPKITWKSVEKKIMFDDCMSFPDLLVKLERHSSISVEYKNENFETKKMENLDFDISELIQHEYDHLDGILAIDRALPSGKDSVIYRESLKFFDK